MTDPRLLEEALRGVGVTPVTPFTPDCTRIEVKGVSQNIEFLVERGIKLIYPCGHTGEFPSLSLEEWTQVVEAVVEAVGGRAAVVPGVGQGLSVALEMLRRGERIGVDGFLFIPPHQVQVADRGVLEYWNILLNTTAFPVVLYKREWPSDEALAGLLGHDQVVGVKYGGKDLSAFAALVRARDESIVWTCGIAEQWAPFYALAGSQGFTSGLANFAPSLPLDLHRALEKGDLDRAMRLRERAVPFERIRARDSDANNVAAVKLAMDIRGLTGGPVRPPLRALDEDTTTEVERVVRELPRVH